MLIIANSIVSTRKEALSQLIDFDILRVYQFISWGYNPNIVRVKENKCLIIPMSINIDFHEREFIKVKYDTKLVNIKY